MKKILLLCLAASALASPALAADLPTKAAPKLNPIFAGYPYATSGLYWGLNTLGGGGSVNATGAGVNPNSVVSNQAGAGVTIGYAWGMANTPVFYAVEAMFDVQNFNGTQPGLSFNGPASFEQRFKLGTPLSNFLSLFPNNFGLPAVPPFPTLPNGVVATNVQPYLMVGVHEDDVSVNFGTARNTAWRIAPSVGAGALAQLTKGVAVDVWAETIFPSGAVCTGISQNQCSTMGQQFKVGLGLYY